MRSLLNSLLVSVCCLCLIAFAPMTALADDLNETALLADDGEEGSIQLHITKECTTASEDIKPGAVVTYKVQVWATSDGIVDLVAEPVVYHQLRERNSLTSIDEVQVKGNIFTADVTASGSGFSMQLSDGVNPGFNVKSGTCVITYKAVVSDTAKAGDKLSNTAVFEAYTDDFDNPDVVSSTATITIAGEGGSGDDSGSDDGSTAGNEAARATDHSPDCGDHSLDFLKIFCPILWLL